jgi:nitroreductase
MMESHHSLDEIFKTRRSVRSYRKDPLRPGDLQLILNAAFLSPSGAAKQGIQLVAVIDPSLKVQIRAVCEKGEQEWVMQQYESVKNTILNLPQFSFTKEFLTDAPVLIIVSTRLSDPNVPYAIESCWMMITYLVLKITEYGYGTLTYTPSLCLSADRIRLNDLIRLPHSEAIQAILPIGFPAPQPQNPQSTVPLSPPSEGKIHYNYYGISQPPPD